MKHYLTKICSLLSLSILLSGCLISEIHRESVASRIASPAWMKERQIPAEPFLITAFERMHERNDTANIYISGDGYMGLVIDLNTPKNPVALHLASRDSAENIAYVARPCLYSGMLDKDEICPLEYKTNYKFSGDILRSVDTAINDIKDRYDITNIHLIAYSGGATVAGVLAANRNDVLSLRTVAGQFELSALESSLPALRNMPQHHFIGGNDKIAGLKEFEKYRQALGQTSCLDATVLPEATHEEEWVEPWPDLLKYKTPKCTRMAAPEFEPVLEPETVFVPRMSGDKK